LWCQDELAIYRDLGGGSARVGQRGEFAATFFIKEIGIGGTQTHVGAKLGTGRQKAVLQKQGDRQSFDLGKNASALQ
jgi:hypothetical protein